MGRKCTVVTAGAMVGITGKWKVWRQGQQAPMVWCTHVWDPRAACGEPCSRREWEEPEFRCPTALLTPCLPPAKRRFQSHQNMLGRGLWPQLHLFSLHLFLTWEADLKGPHCRACSWALLLIFKLNRRWEEGSRVRRGYLFSWFPPWRISQVSSCLLALLHDWLLTDSRTLYPLNSSGFGVATAPLLPVLFLESHPQFWKSPFVNQPSWNDPNVSFLPIFFFWMTHHSFIYSFNKYVLCIKFQVLHSLLGYRTEL